MSQIIKFRLLTLPVFLASLVLTCANGDSVGSKTMFAKKIIDKMSLMSDIKRSALDYSRGCYEKIDDYNRRKKREFEQARDSTKTLIEESSKTYRYRFVIDRWSYVTEREVGMVGIRFGESLEEEYRMVELGMTFNTGGSLERLKMDRFIDGGLGLHSRIGDGGMGLRLPQTPIPMAMEMDQAIQKLHVGIPKVCIYLVGQNKDFALNPLPCFC